MLNIKILLALCVIALTPFSSADERRGGHFAGEMEFYRNGRIATRKISIHTSQVSCRSWPTRDIAFMQLKFGTFHGKEREEFLGKPTLASIDMSGPLSRSVLPKFVRRDLPKDAELSWHASPSTTADVSDPLFFHFQLGAGGVHEWTELQRDGDSKIKLLAGNLELPLTGGFSFLEHTSHQYAAGIYPSGRVIAVVIDRDDGDEHILKGRVQGWSNYWSAGP